MRVCVIVLMFLTIFVVYSSATVNNILQCTGTTKPIENLGERVKIGACKKTPCRLRKNSVVKVEIKFKPEKDIPTLKNNIYAVIVGVPFPFVGYDGTNACETIFKADGVTKASCPLKAGEEYVYKQPIEVLQIYPRVKTVVHWGLVGPEGDVTCFEAPARITN